MSPGKRNQSKGERSNSRTAGGLPLALLIVLLALAVGGIVAVKFFQSPAGRVRLLDAGLETYHAQVQDEIGRSLRATLDQFGAAGAVVESVRAAYVHGKPYHYLAWTVTCPQGSDIVRINVALTKAVRKFGGVVRRSEERADTLWMDIGTRRYDTHRLILTRRHGESAVGAAARPVRPRLAVVIDDFGYSRDRVVEEMLSMDLPLTISILPSLPYSLFALERAQEAGKCTLLHLPMEPDEERETDLDMVATGMDDVEIARLVDRYVGSLPGIRGVNNHQGSRATADPRVMAIVLETVEEHGLFFLDSLTSPKSVAYNAAKEMGVAASRNDLFIDADTEDPEVIAERIRHLAAIAKERGWAVGIGHPRRWTLEALKKSEGYVRDAGVEMVSLQDIVE